jgi:O-antigen/teichoic acid export membrane protein
MISVENMIASTGFFALISAVGAASFLKKNGVSIHPEKLRLRREAFSSGFVYAVGISSASVQNDGDKAALNGAHFVSIAGWYGLAYRVVSMAYMPISAAVSATHQVFLDPGRKSKGALALRYSLIALGYSVVAAAILWVAAPLLPVFVSHKFDNSVQMVKWLAVMLIPRSLSAFPIHALMGIGKTRQRTALLVASAVLSLVLYATLIPSMNWKGAVWATLIVETFLVISSWFLLIFNVNRDRRTPAHGRSRDETSAATSQPALAKTAFTGRRPARHRAPLRSFD